jgi:NAD(P)-dependent dehydrogenase (short-subunit alcohol dehydrogenase family)
VKSTAREALVLGGRGELPGALAERLGKLGHRVTRLQAEDTPVPLSVDLLVHLDTTPGESDPGEPVELEHALSRARASFDVIQRATSTMKGRAFGRIVQVRSIPPPGPTPSLTGAMSAFASAGTLGMLQELARQVARFGVTLNMVTLTQPPSGGDSPPPLQRQATVTEVAKLVEMLCHDQAGFMTAQCFSIVSTAG